MLVDRRAQIRKDRSVEQTAGPPPDPKHGEPRAVAPGGAQAVSVRTSDTHSLPRSLKKFQPVSSAGPVEPCLDGEILADIEFSRKVTRLQRAGERATAEFLLVCPKDERRPTEGRRSIRKGEDHLVPEDQPI
jgi:hypothetical protein